MLATVTQFSQGISAPETRQALLNIISPIADRMGCRPLTTAGLVIKAASGTLVKTGAAAFYALASGVLVTKAAATDMAALVGTVTNAKFNAFSFFVDSAGTLTAAMGTEGAALGNIKFAPVPAGKTFIGFAIINPTGTGNFVGGTTALDDATVVPNAVYISLTAGVDPSILV